MPIINDGKQWRYKDNRRIPGQKHGRKINRGFGPGKAGRLAAQKFELEYEAQLSDGSLTGTTVAQCVEHYEAHKGHGGFSAATYRYWKDTIGHMGAESQRLSDAFYREIDRLKARGLSPNTINNYRCVLRSVLNYAYKTHMIDKVMIRSFGLEATKPRDRVFQGDEEQRLQNVLAQEDSWMQPHIEFMSKNPVRVNDVLELRRDAYNMVHRVVTFWAKKTSRSPNAMMAHCGEVSEDLHNWFMSLPADCPWLFPRIDKKGNWHRPNYMGFKHHFDRMMKLAGIPDFTPHDLKHVSTTYMLTKRRADGTLAYSIEDLKKLGLCLSEKIVRDVYYNRNAMDIVLASREISHGNVGEAKVGVV